MNAPVAHQRIIRDEAAARDPGQLATLDGCTVQRISRQAALPLILTYEWLGDMGRAQHFFGLIAPHSGALIGAACFGYGPAGQIRNRIGDPALCLERGACTHRAPPNAASFLISRACKDIAAKIGVHRFFAYGDPMAGEYGAVYQACNWAYLGQGIDGDKERRLRTFVLPPGAANAPANWKTTRALRRNGNRMGYEEAEAAGWTIAQRPAKHVYATFVGPGRREWLKRLGELPPYPKPRPELKSYGKAQVRPS
jgi:hypothetical protein